MDNWADCQGMPITSRRYLQRQWKRNKPHLPPSDSLPTLRLCPKRPLFVCARCGFANAWIPLCLWCEWSSAEATKQFESNMPRPRRLSAPCKVVLAPRRVKRELPKRMSADSITSSTGPVTPQGELSFSSRHSVRSVPGITTVLEPPLVDNHGEPGHTSEGIANHDAVASADVRMEVDDVGVVQEVATATSIMPQFSTSSLSNTTSELQTEQYKRVSEDQDLTRKPMPHRKRPAALSVSTPPAHIRASYCSSHKVECTASLTTHVMNSMTSVLLEASNLPRATDCMYVSSGSQMSSTHSISSSQCSPMRGLRRTKHMALHKRKSSQSPHSRSRPSSPLRESVDVPATSTMEVRHVLSIAPSQDNDPPVRLGHPSRPYYSAIRRNMPRPTSPAFSISTPRTPSPMASHLDYAPRETRSLDGGRRSIHAAPELRPMSMVLPGQAMSATTCSGFSLSGETEMRMNLARWRREDAPDEPGDYHFREMDRSGTKMDVKGKVRKLSKGLKDLVLRRS
ncbi:hypothetical protein PAXRUDRAFT_260195 [Paxillus rubicundulus Ve08.2h10]|uniref:Uncharacterized protein n=1 Tax=Paxillus rubicundulus Ve08.2h10 TaxID=930991 RepID=A0A0D0DTB7_9AGAM|nr:hypothetical protein PAXRUDRAFT_260195 [Paxillus rubicundulus Ve08.2h10]